MRGERIPMPRFASGYAWLASLLKGSTPFALPCPLRRKVRGRRLAPPPEDLLLVVGSSRRIFDRLQDAVELIRVLSVAHDSLEVGLLELRRHQVVGVKAEDR